MFPCSIYILINPVNQHVFYVGQTSMPILKRLSCHIYSDKPLSTVYGSYMNLLKSLGIKPEIVEVDTCDYGDIEAIEEFWVHLMLSFGFDLINTKHNYKN